MSDRKEHRPLGHNGNGISNGIGQRPGVPAGIKRRGRLVASSGNEVAGWDAYRRWLTRVQAPEKRRMPLDPGLYTWKGYRKWTDKVRREWEPEKG